MAGPGDLVRSQCRVDAVSDLETQRGGEGKGGKGGQSWRNLGDAMALGGRGDESMWSHAQPGHQWEGEKEGSLHTSGLKCQGISQQMCLAAMRHRRMLRFWTSSNESILVSISGATCARTLDENPSRRL